MNSCKIKEIEWFVEDEYRIISRKDHIEFGNEIKITRILLGPKIEPKMIPVWKAIFKRLIGSDKIDVCETTIGDAGKVVEVIE